MLPTAHIEITWAALSAIQRATGNRLWKDTDYRLVALASIAPDLLDKPLAVFAFPQANSALLFGHTLLAHASVWGGLAASGRLRPTLPYLAAFSGHLVADRMWGFGQTLWWPFRVRKFHQWKHVGSTDAILRAYRDIIKSEPKLLVFEAAGLALFIWFVMDRGLFRRKQLCRFLLSGKPASFDGD